MSNSFWKWSQLRIFLNYSIPKNNFEVKQINKYMDVLKNLNCKPYSLNILNKLELESPEDIKKEFEKKFNLEFNPQNFRDVRTKLLSTSSGIIQLEFDQSNCGFEVAYNLYEGSKAPILIASHENNSNPNAQIMTQNLDIHVPTEYHTFKDSSDLEEVTKNFIDNLGRRYNLEKFSYHD
eukprot:TRINITY_DN11679_c0_g1_i1.p1 TRINITY_DN11679_c0_g1~~TRINITY_DN11679_c0_g1_i1.p1  ORF type:complete len:195 (-),score=31.14 TRINITY_DN11679_c0_g1_i1:188-724(-)